VNDTEIIVSGLCERAYLWWI